MRALLVDPFQRKVHPIEVTNDIHDWYKWCDCALFDTYCLGNHTGEHLDALVDDEGLLKEPHYPMWKWKTNNNPVAGYGLILGLDDSNGESLPVKMLPETALAHIDWWERWEDRLDPKDYFDQLSRIYVAA